MFKNTPISMLEKSLDVYNFKHQVISNNIANANTPGYKRKDVKFNTMLENLLAKEKKATKMNLKRGLELNFQNFISVDNSTSFRIDGNNVDIDKELAVLAENTIMFNSLVQQINSQLSQVRLAINEGRG